jgi:predicted Fe-S protein YdhL (DUF1289 family)
MCWKLAVASRSVGALAMTDAVTVTSPCSGVCRLNAQQVCVGCGRTGMEIGEWLAASDARRESIRAAASARLKSLQQTQSVVSHE